ncbi:MAG: nitroreductase family protein [Candidatus Zixiibacteriota bacterium]|nr:MAG: nitroreductase family protein [candidate division Zixibacteria bacterium]
MSGIVFFKTGRLEELTDFYVNRLNCRVWLNQEDCIIIKADNLLLGFCQRDEVDREGVLTFFSDSREDVDRAYERLKETAQSLPQVNDKYHIYHFFANDPEGRKLEFQCFDHHVDCHRDGGELLLTRRSIREFRKEEVPPEVIERVLSISRFAPTSRNTQSYYFKLIREKQMLARISEVRGKSSSPIARAPMAVAICSDPELSKRHLQDGCIAAYHFILSAWYYGLGTCWIAAMDRDDVKQMLNIPESHYIATITPLGYPERFPVRIPERRELSWFVRE